MPTKLQLLEKLFKESKNSTEQFTEYQVGNADNVSLSLTFGTGGVSVDTNVRLDRKFIVQDEQGDIKNHAVGTGDEILGSTMVCFCLLTRTAAMGDSKTLKITVAIHGGPSDFVQTMEQTVSGFDSKMFRIEVVFIR
jgi:hypothetical protein